MPTQDSKIIYPYRIAGPYMDQGVPPMQLGNGALSELVGADGRYLGCIRRFPGMDLVKNLTTLRSGISNITFFKYAVVRNVATNNFFRGWVVRYTHSTAVKISFFYYSTADSSWSYAQISEAVTNTTAVMDCDSRGRFLYVTIKGETNYPKTVYYDGANWQVKTSGPGSYPTGSANLLAFDNATAQAGGSGKLEDGTYLVAYRFYDSTRNVYSGLSVESSVTLSSGATNQFIRVDLEDTGTYTSSPVTQFTHVEFFRSMNNEVAGQSLQGGIFYLEKTLAVASVWTGTVGQNVNLGEILDTQLVTKQPYQPYADVVNTPPSSGAFHHFQGISFMGRDPADVGGAVGLRWSPVYKLAPEDFHEDRSYYDRIDDGEITQFAEAGDVLYGFTPAVIYRITKSGTGLSTQKLHYGRGLTAYGAAHSVARDILLMTPLGLAVIDGLSGRMDLMAAVDRKILGSWAGDLGDTISCYDAKLGCSFFINKTDDDAICVWHTTRTTNLLEDMTFCGCTEGPDITAGGMIRAYFCRDDCQVFMPLVDTVGNMGDVDGTVDGTATGGDTNTLLDTTATFNANCVGSELHILTGANAGLSRTISVRNTATSIDVDAVFPSAIVAGVRYSIAPVVFRVRFRPLPANDPRSQDFERRITQAITLHSQKHVGTTGNANAYWKMGVFRSGGTTLADYVWVAMDDAIPYNQAGAVNADGVQLEPYLEIIASGITFELTGMQVTGKMTVSRRTV